MSDVTIISFSKTITFKLKMNKKYHTLFIVFIFLINSNLSYSQPTQKITYKEFLEAAEASSTYTKAWREKKINNEYQKWIDVLKKAIKSKGYASQSYNIGDMYAKMNKYDSALYYMKESYKYGVKLQYTDTILFKNYLSELKESYTINRAYYVNQVDSALIKKLSLMWEKDQKYRNYKTKNRDSLYKYQPTLDSLNQIELKKMVEKDGWFPDAKLGEDFYKKPTIIITHSDQKTHLFFLKYVVEAAEKNLIHWFDCEMIMLDFFKRFEQEDGLNKLRFTYLDKNGNIDLERSYFQLKVLARLPIIYRTPKIITLFATYYNENDKNKFSTHTKNLQQIKKFLIEEGYPEDQIKIKYEFRKVIDDKLGNFMFGFTTEDFYR
ncbi:MAG: hypothetical protein EAZ85_12860 [Bacteroidetes bacterium]|nr:MAG: hypothetical protein EAZ85_12860 [Bacteroidota bacterium]TAG87281.1 MAG: hypothetical protein EAZ20_10920 [Bacteroidota bacterium]